MWKTKGWERFRKSLILPVFLVAAFSFLTSFSFAPYRFAYLALFSLVPLFYFIQKAVQAREAWIYGFIAGLAFFLYHLQWLSVFGWLPWVALALYQALLWGLASLLIKIAIDSGWGWLSPFLWVGVEFVRSLGPGGFGWGLLGQGQTDSFFSLVFPFFGVWGASFLIVAFNLLISRFISKRQYKKVGVLAVFLAAGTIIFPSFPEFDSRLLEDSGSLKAILVQTAVPQKEKITGEAGAKFLETLSRLKTRKLKKGSLVVFPETAYPYPLSENSEVQREVLNLAKEKQSWVLVGAFREENGESFNSAFLFSPDGKCLFYDKVHLVPFGEFWPLRPYLNWLPYACLLKEDLSPGSKLGLLPYKESHLGVAICFESSDPLLIFSLVRKGADVLVFITNDSWFDRTDALAQHFQIAQVRASETGRLVLQVANTGFTGVISPGGKIIDQARLYQPVVLAEDINFKQSDTFFVSWGYLFPLISLILTVSFLAYRIYLSFCFRC